MTNKEAIQIIERILDPDPWEYINWSDKAKEALEMAVDALDKQKVSTTTCCGYDIQELIAFGQICRRHKIKDSDLKEFIADCAWMWKVMENEFNKKLEEDFKHVMNGVSK